jgi:hypothetical protein
MKIVVEFDASKVDPEDIMNYLEDCNNITETITKYTTLGEIISKYMMWLIDEENYERLESMGIKLASLEVI